MNYFAKERQEFIEQMTRDSIDRCINRADLMDGFGVSAPTASHDLKLFMELRPGVIYYNKHTKRYERVEDVAG